MDQHKRVTTNGLNGYLADGTRVQVPTEHPHIVWLVRDFEELPLDLCDIGSTAPRTTKRRLDRLHYLIPSGVLGPVEGDGSWWVDPLDGARIVTLWVERGSEVWNRLHRKSEHCRRRHHTPNASSSA